MVRSTPAAKQSESTSPSAANQISDDVKFETALTELEQIVQNMEAGNLSLEDSITAYRRGSELLKHCQRQLSDAERKIQVLEDGSLRDFDSNSGERP